MFILAPRVARPRPLAIGVLLAIAITGLVLSLPSRTEAQPIPVTRLAYSAKFMCGQANFDFSLPPGSVEYTVIELHNPHTVAIVCSVKVVQDYPNPQLLIPKYAVTVGPNGTLDFSCATLFPGFDPRFPLRRGFVEIISPRQVKVVTIHKEILNTPGRIISVSIAKKSSPGFIIQGFVRHSGTFLYGNQPQASGDTIRHETLISLADMSPNPVNANISIVSKTGLVTSFPRPIPPNGLTTITGADLPASTPLPFTGGVTVQYPDIGFGVLLECEEIIQKHAISGTMGVAMGMSVTEVQPIPIR